MRSVPVTRVVQSARSARGSVPARPGTGSNSSPVQRHSAPTARGPRVALGGAVAQAQRPGHGVVAVVTGLGCGVGGDGGERTATGGELRVQQLLPGGVEQLPDDGVREVPVRLLDELEVAEVALVAAERQLVLVAREGEQRAGLAEQVEREVGEGHLLLQDGRVPGPFGEPVGEDQRVVAEGEGRLPFRLRQRGRGHRCRTPSGTS